MKKHILSLALCVLMLGSFLLPTVAYATNDTASIEADAAQQTDGALGDTDIDPPLTGESSNEDDPDDSDPDGSVTPDGNDLNTGSPVTTPAKSNRSSFEDITISFLVTDENGGIVTEDKLEPGHTYEVSVSFYNPSTVVLYGTSVSLSASEASKGDVSYSVRIYADNLNVSRKNYSEKGIYLKRPADVEGTMYVSGSAVFSTAEQPDGVALPDVELLNYDIGTMVGYTEMDGELPAGRKNICNLAFKITTGEIATGDSNTENPDSAKNDTKDQSVSNKAVTPSTESGGQSSDIINNTNNVDNANSAEKGNLAGDGRAVAQTASHSVLLVVAIVVMTALSALNIGAVYLMWRLCRHLGVEYPLLDRIVAAWHTLTNKVTTDDLAPGERSDPDKDVDHEES